MMRIHRLLAATLVIASACAVAEDRRYDPKALARYDISYVRCETSYPEMKGHRDEAYRNLWRIKPGPKADARLAEIRKSAPYQAERKLASREAAAASAPATAKIEGQCRGLWGETQRLAKPR